MVYHRKDLTTTEITIDTTGFFERITRNSR